MKKIGIYKITNISNNKVYIGQSVNINKRISEHKRKLLNNTHVNEHLQNSYNYYGKDYFNYKVIELCDTDSLTNRELYWISHYKSHNREYGYNKNMPSSDMERFELSEDTKLKIGIANRKFDKEELISYIQEFYYHNNRVPTQRDLVDNAYPSYNVYIDNFGTFKNALIVADVYDFVENKKLFERKIYSKEEVYEAFKCFIDKFNRFPNAFDLKNTKENNLPVTSVIMKHYDSIEDLKKEFGYGKEAIMKSENLDAISKLKLLYENDGYVTSRTIDKSKITRSAKFYSNRFGSLVNAYKLAGIPLEEGVINKGTFKAVNN